MTRKCYVLRQLMLGARVFFVSMVACSALPEQMTPSPHMDIQLPHRQKNVEQKPVTVVISGSVFKEMTCQARYVAKS